MNLLFSDMPKTRPHHGGLVADAQQLGLGLCFVISMAKLSIEATPKCVQRMVSRVAILTGDKESGCVVCSECNRSSLSCSSRLALHKVEQRGVLLVCPASRWAAMDGVQHGSSCSEEGMPGCIANCLCLHNSSFIGPATAKTHCGFGTIPFALGIAFKRISARFSRMLVRRKYEQLVSSMASCLHVQ